MAEDFKVKITGLFTNYDEIVEKAEHLKSLLKEIKELQKDLSASVETCELKFENID